MNLKSALVVGLSVWTLSGCGEEKQTPCSGDNCLDVSGEYAVTANSPPEGNTCESIFYGGAGADGTPFTLHFTLAQSGSDLTYTFSSARLGLTASGTLFDNKTALVKQHVDHMAVKSSDGSESWDYADDTQVTLSFSEAEGVFQVTGSLTDSLRANGETPVDVACTLVATFNGQR